MTNTTFNEFKQVPLELTGGKVLYAHPDGYFANALGQKIQHNFSPAMQRGDGGSKYPKMRNFGNKLCHHLMYETFYGPRSKGMEIDHINGDKLDYSAANLEEVTPAENRRRAKYIRVMRDCNFDPRIFNAKDLHHWFSMPFEEFKSFFEHYKND